MILPTWLGLKRNVPTTFGTAHFVEHQIASNFQQPGGKFGARDISTSAFPDPNKDLLRDIFHVRVAPEHARHGAGDETLVPFNKVLECTRIAPTHQPHESHVLSVFLRSPWISWIVATHRSLRRVHGRNLLTIWRVTKICSFVTFVAMVFVASRKRAVHAWSARVLPRSVDELPAYSKRT